MKFSMNLFCVIKKSKKIIEFNTVITKPIPIVKCVEINHEKKKCG